MKAALFVPLSLLLLRSSFAGTISEPFDGGTWWGLNGQPVGQTFTADASSLVSAMFYLKASPDFPQGPARFTYSLLAGEGTNGAVLATSSFSLPNNFTGPATGNFASVPLTVGEHYTILVNTTNIYWEIGGVVTFLPGEPNYPGGAAVFAGVIYPTLDLGFQIETVPEPSSALVLACGACAGAFARALRTSRLKKRSASGQ